MFWILTLSRLDVGTGVGGTGVGVSPAPLPGVGAGVGVGRGVGMPPVPWMGTVGVDEPDPVTGRLPPSTLPSIDESVEIADDPSLHGDERPRGMRAIESDVALPRRGEALGSERNLR